MLIQRGDAVVVEPGGARAEDRHVLPRGAERLAVAHELPGDVPAGVLGSPPLELVDRDDVGEVQHVDLLELGGGAELGGHDVERDVDERHDRGVALADAGRLDDHQVVPRRLAGGDRLGQVLGQLRPGAPGGEGAEVGAPAREAVHPDSVAEQRAPAAAPRRVDGEDGDAELVLLVGTEPADELVGERALARAPGAGDAEHRHATVRGYPAQASPRSAPACPPCSTTVIARASARRRRRAPPRRWVPGRRGRRRTPRPWC